MTREFLLPDLGEGIAEAQVIRVLVKAGEDIAEDQYLMEVETDKAAVEIPSPYAGKAKTIHVEEGQTINVGEVIVTFDDDVEGGGQDDGAQHGGASGSKPATKKAPMAVVAASSEKPAASKVAAPPAVSASTRRTTAPAAPAVRKLAREMKIDLDTVTGSGPGGRVTKKDLENHRVSAAASAGAGPAMTASPGALDAPPAIPGEPGTDKWGPVHREPLRQIRKTIATQMTRAAFTIPHVTHVDEANITELDRIRRALNEATDNNPKLTAMTFLIKAICLALRKFPAFNASFDEEGGQMIYKDYINMGIAVDTARGLIVPTIRHADQLTIRGVARELRSIADKVRANQFEIEDLRGGTFTITNVGALGGSMSTPIINHPEVAILALGRSRKTPIVVDDEITVAMILPLCLSFDHRATDGANAARFTSEIISYLEMPTRFLLDA